MLKHPHPSPPPQAGEGAHYRCRCALGFICDCPAWARPCTMADGTRPGQIRQCRGCPRPLQADAPAGPRAGAGAGLSTTQGPSNLV